MQLVSVELRDFRSYERATVRPAAGVTVVSGPNGAGKTNLLEAVYFACTGRSCRTSNDREVVRFGASAARLEADVLGGDGPHHLAVGFEPGETKRATVDGAAVERLTESPHRPLVSVFLPDRLELIKGVPALRRAHLDQVVAAIWPSRIASRRAYNQALAQRNSLLSRIRTGTAQPSALSAWDQQLAAAAIPLMKHREESVRLITPAFEEACDRLGLDGLLSIVYRSRSRASGTEEFVQELGDRWQSDIERGFTLHGPHRDDLLISRDGRELRTYGSQGQQRLALLGLLLAERRVIADLRDSSPVLLLDDVMSELDRDRRAALVEVVTEAPGQTLITTTDPDLVPELENGESARIVVAPGGELRPLTTAGALR